VVGIEAAETEFPSGEAPDYDVYTTNAFARAFVPRTAPYVSYLVDLRHGEADFALFQAEVRAAGLEGSPDQIYAAHSSWPHYLINSFVGLRASCSFSSSFPGTWKATAFSIEMYNSDSRGE
jgi:hypothetical protein